MTVRAGFFSATQKFDVTAVADSFTVQGANESKHAFLVQSDKTVHITRDGEDASADNGLRIPAGTLVLINTTAGDVISYILGEGETDGAIWFTEVDH